MDANAHLNYAKGTDHKKNNTVIKQLNKMRRAMFSIFVNMASKIDSRNPQLCTSFPSKILCTSSTLGTAELQ
jgi:hypothetical protein